MPTLYNVLKYRRAGIAQLVEHNLAKVGVASSSLVSRSKFSSIAAKFKRGFLVLPLIFFG
jgi:hypothetical protein